jgi:hypothetical protein
VAVYKIPLLTKHPPLPVFSNNHRYQPVPPGDHWQTVALLFFRKDTLPPLPDGPSYKTHYPIQLSCCTLNPSVSLAICAPINLHFLHMVRSLFSSSLQFWDRVSLCSPDRSGTLQSSCLSCLSLSLPSAKLWHLLSLSLSLGLWACKTGTLSFEPHLQPILLWLFWRWSLSNSLPRLSSNLNLLYLFSPK